MFSVPSTNQSGCSIVTNQRGCRACRSQAKVGGGGIPVPRGVLNRVRHNSSMSRPCARASRVIGTSM
jgi:hypothetical protein